MNLKELKEMIALMEGHGLSELEIEKNGFKIRLKKPAAAAEKETTGASEPPPVPEISNRGAEKPRAEDANTVTVRSPMVGTFYAAPAPDQDPYVKAGKQVQEGDVLCIIEAMKLMNEIKSEVSGRLVDILVENGQPIEFDQPLFKIQKS